MKSILGKKSRGSTNLRPAKFIAPGDLAKVYGYGQKGPNAIGESNENTSNHMSTYGANKVQEDQPEQFISTRRIIGGLSNHTTHTITVHFGEDKYIEDGFTEDSCFLDILKICRKFIDVYTKGITITDGDFRPIRNDRDFLNVVIDHEGVQNIDIYVDWNPTAQPLLFKLPQDSSITTPVTKVPKVINVAILGEYKRNQNVRVQGDLIDGSEQGSTVQWFISNSKHFDIESDLQAISECTTNKEFKIPIEAVNHFLVVKYTPKTRDGISGEIRCTVTDKYVEDLEPQKPRVVRGKNKNKKIAALKSTESLRSKFTITVQWEKITVNGQDIWGKL